MHFEKTESPKSRNSFAHRFQSFSELLSKFILGIGYDLWNVHTVRERCLLVCAIDHLIRELVSSRINSRSVREH
jgi:hypothetical protein